ncbi:MAG: hypothetical protein IKD43_01155 [Clostridia bacterium]|nr:hypothetical protein [Clostridia bacterium]
MSWLEILIIIAAAMFVLAVIVNSIVRRIQGKRGCGYCSSCSSCRECKHISAPNSAHKE